MKTIACHTLGCKVNQYDTQAMLEKFLENGWTTVPFNENADVYLLNTCTVTGTGDKKSLQLARKIKRDHPLSRLILCGCLAQRKPEALLETGADLIIGTQKRGDVISLLAEVNRTGKPLCAVSPLQPGMPYESLEIHTQEEHTRATLKIQEGCNNHCTYCIIPSVRGPIRSRPLNDIRRETEILAKAGYREIVLTGIHLSSFGKDLGNGITLLDAIHTVHEIPGILRIRLGSLEPTIATEAFSRALKEIPEICPQFHLALQSGSDSVLARMKRRYNTAMYRAAAAHLRESFPDCALTTDVLTGFPGESEKEYQETKDFIREIGYARIHVFPYSPREDTPAAIMEGQLSTAEKERRARELISLGHEVAQAWLSRRIGKTDTVLLEEKNDNIFAGYTPEYIRVTLPAEEGLCSGQTIAVRLCAPENGGMKGVLLS